MKELNKENYKTMIKKKRERNERTYNDNGKISHVHKFNTVKISIALKLSID